MLVIPSCDWAPASHPYTGTPEDAIMAFSDIPIHVRETLIEKAKNYTYDDVVVIKRDSIKGRNDYLPDLRNMHGGSKGAVCLSPSRVKWSDSQTERGMVFCDSGYCVVRPSVCNNWSIIYQTFLLDRGEAFAIPYYPFNAFEGIAPLEPASYLPLSILQTGSEDYAPLYGYWLNNIYYENYFYGNVGYFGAINLPVPEPSIYHLFLLGLIFLKVKNVSKQCTARR